MFGVALDPSDDPLSLELKRTWMGRTGGGEDGKARNLDPYDAARTKLWGRWVISLEPQWATKQELSFKKE